MLLYIKLILSVSLTATVPFCIYLLLKRRLDTNISAAFQYRLLKFFLFCFIFPFSLVKGLLVSSITPKPLIVLNNYVYLDNTIVRTNDGLILIPQGDFYKFFLAVLFTILILIVCYQLYSYLHYRHKAIHQLESDTMHQNEFTALKAELGLRRPVSLLYSSAAISPYTYGLFHPCVVITSIVPEDAVPMVIRHELQHIKSHDFLFRIAAFLVLLLHCWNPFIYLLWMELCEIQELACDEKITAKLSSKEVQHYGYSLISIAAALQQQLPFSTRLAQNNKKSLRRRITCLGKHSDRKSDRKSLAASVFISLAVLIGFCTPIAAYSPEILYYGTDQPDEDLSSIDWIYTELQSGDSPTFPEDEVHFQYTDQYFILEDGTIIDDTVENPFSIKGRAACVHSWAKATKKVHQRNGKGCNVLTYAIDLCAKCNSVKNQILENKSQYTTCPH